MRLSRESMDKFGRSDGVPEFPSCLVTVYANSKQITEELRYAVRIEGVISKVNEIFITCSLETSETDEDMETIGINEDFEETQRENKKQCLIPITNEEGMEFKNDYQRREQLEEEKLKSGEKIQKAHEITINTNEEMLQSQLEIERAKVKELDASIQEMKSLLPGMRSDINPDDLDLLVAAEKTFSGEANTLDWADYGFKMHFPQGTTPPSEVLIKALVGGKFQFPDGMEVVSALYLVSISEEFLQPLELEIQHCVCLKSSQQCKYLSFITAPIDESVPPYKFQFIEGGKFYTDSQYGMIARSKFCLMGIGKKINGGKQHSSSDEEEDPPSDEDGTSSESNSETQLTSGNGGILSTENDMPNVDVREATESVLPDTQEKNSSENIPVSQDVQNRQDADTERVIPKHTTTSKEVQDCYSPDNLYTGQVCYVKEGMNRWCMVFMVVQNIEVFLKHLEEKYSNAEKEPDYFQFCFLDPMNGFVELVLTQQQYKGWTIDPRRIPLRIRKRDANLYGIRQFPRPPCCKVTVFADPTKEVEKYLSYCVPLNGVDSDDVKEICIQRFLETSNISETTTLPQSPTAIKEQQTVPLQYDIRKLRQLIVTTINKNYARLSDLIETSLKDVTNKFFQAQLITQSVKNDPTPKNILKEFTSGMEWIDNQSDMEERCKKFLEVCQEMGGTFLLVLKTFKHEWIEATKQEMGISLSL